MADSAILVRVLVSKAHAMNTASAGTGTTWLEGIRDTALAAVLEGDVEVNYAQFEGGAASGSRKINSSALLEIAQLALEELAAEDGAGAGDSGPATTVHMDFSRRFVQA